MMNHPTQYRRRTDIDRNSLSSPTGEDEVRAALEAAGFGIFDYYPLSGELNWNRTAKEHFGLSVDAPVNYNVFLVGVHPDDRKHAVQALHGALQREDQGRLNIEFRAIGIEDGKERRIALGGQAFFNQWGEGARFLGTTREIAVRAPAISAGQADDLFRRVFDNVYEGILLHAADGSIVDMNDRFLEMYQVSREQLRKMSIAQISAPSNPLDELPRIWSRVIAGEKQLFEWKAKRPLDDSLFEVEVFLTRMEMRGQALILATVRDISKRKQLERRLREGEEYYRVLFNRSPLPKWVFELESMRILEVNEAAMQHYGYSREEFLGLTLAEIRVPEEFEKLVTWIRNCCSRGEKLEGRVQTKHRKKNNEVIDVEVRYAEIVYNGRRAGLGAVIDITERKHNEEKLRWTRDLLKGVMEGAGTHVAVIGTDFRFLAFNTAYREEFRKLFGQEIKVGDHVGRMLAQLPADQADALKVWGRALQGETFVAEQEFGDPKRKRVFLELRFSPVRDRLGNLIGATQISSDISRRKKAEEAVLDSRAKLKAALNSMTDAVFISDVEGRFIDFNDACAVFHRFRNREECAKTFGEYSDILDVFTVNGEAAPVEQWAVPRALRGEIATNEEYILRRKDTGEKWVGSYSFAPIRDQQGSIIGSVVAGRDVTEQKRAEEALRASEARFRQMADAMPQLVWTATPEGTVDYYNRRVGEFEGFERHVDDAWHWSPVLHPEDAERSVQVWRQAIATGEPYEIEHRVRRKDGAYRWYLSRGEAARDASGRIVKWYGTATDINDLKEAQSALKDSEEALKRSVAELERSNTELQQFAYVASHDLQEPLRTVGSYVELLAVRYKGKIDPTADRYISFVVEGVNRMSALLNDLLAYSRVGTRGKPFAQVQMRRIYELAAGNLRTAIRESGARITVDELPEVAGDDTQLLLLVQNLIANGVKFRKRDAKPEIHISARRGENEWIFSVKDNGIGIEPRFFERIFVIFQRLHTREEYEGTGVGLAICRRIVERHRGRIWVESKPGEGSTFYFSIADKKQ